MLGAICTLSRSFSNDGPPGTLLRYIGDTATSIARDDDLFTGTEERLDASKVDVSMNAAAGPGGQGGDPGGQGAEFVRGQGAGLPDVLDRLERQLEGGPRRRYAAGPAIPATPVMPA